MTPFKSKYSDYDLAVKKHQYIVEHGDYPQPGATSLIGLLNEDDKASRMAGAAARITAVMAREFPHMPISRLQYVYKEDWDAKADLGSRVHGNISDGSEIFEGDEPYIRAYDQWVADYAPTLVAQEGILLNKHVGYGGRFDLIAKINGRLGLIDFKTGRKHLYQVALQLNAYANAGFGIYDGKGALERIASLYERLPGRDISQGIDFLGVVYLHDDGTYEYIDDLPFNYHMFNDFCRLRELYESLKNFKTYTKAQETVSKKPQAKEAA